eukprot:1076260-Amphidinium_carterae.2
MCNFWGNYRIVWHANCRHDSRIRPSQHQAHKMPLKCHVDATLQLISSANSFPLASRHPGTSRIHDGT